MTTTARRRGAIAGTALLATIALMGIATPAYAATITVDGGGGGDYTTIAAALAAADPGDTITVEDGTYAENVGFTEAVTLQAANPGGATIQGSVTFGAPATLSGFVVELPGASVQVQAGGAGAQIIGNTIGGGEQLIFVAADATAAAPTVIQGNTLTNIQDGAQENAIFISGSSYVNVLDNTITGPTPVLADSVGVNVTSGSTDITISGNTISNFENAVAAIAAGANAITGVTVSNNTISNTTNSALVFGNANIQGVTISGNDITDAGTNGGNAAAVQFGVAALPAPGGSPALDGVVIDDNTVTNAPNGVVLNDGVVLADAESVVVSDNTFAGITGSAVAVAPTVNEPVQATDNDFGGAPVTGNVVVTATPTDPGEPAPTLPETGVEVAAPLIAVLVLLGLGTAALVARRRLAHSR